jgi:hypothetical protein
VAKPVRKPAPVMSIVLPVIMRIDHRPLSAGCRGQYPYPPSGTKTAWCDARASCRPDTAIQMGIAIALCP